MTKVKLLQTELADMRVHGATLDYLKQVQGVPTRSLAMLVCNTLSRSDWAHKYYPCRSSKPAAACSHGTATLLVPAFIIHFD